MHTHIHTHTHACTHTHILTHEPNQPAPPCIALLFLLLLLLLASVASSPSSPLAPSSLNGASSERCLKQGKASKMSATWVVLKQSCRLGLGCNVGTVQTLYHRAKISCFALRGDCAHEKYLFFLGVREKWGFLAYFGACQAKIPVRGWCKLNISRVRG